MDALRRWLNWVPRDTVRCPAVIGSRLGPPTLSVSLNPAHEMNHLPTVSIGTTTASGSQSLRWKFQVGKQRAEVTLTAPLTTIKTAGEAPGASVLLHSSGVAPQPERDGEGINTCGDHASTCTPLVRVSASVKSSGKRKRAPKEGE